MALDNSHGARALLYARGRRLEYSTLGWNVGGIVVLALAAVTARSVALAGFGIDSLIEIGASTIVLWELAHSSELRRRRAIHLVGGAFIGLALYLTAQSTVVLLISFHPHHSTIGIAWTAITAVVMFTLARAKAKTGAALENSVLQTEGRVTFVDGILATTVLVGLGLNARYNWWWADPASGYALVFYATREAITALAH
jgi:divalent metal cation (Fe/Co/Zn/Cd) transporter